MDNTGIVGYSGLCPLCRAHDGTVIKGKDGKYRVICRVMSCHGFYKPLPVDGYGTLEQATNEEAMCDYLDGMTVGKYLTGLDAPMEVNNE